MQSTGHLDVSMAVLHRHLGMGSDQLMKDVLGYEDEAADEAHSRFHEPFWADVKAFPGAADLLREVRSRGPEIVLASSAKSEELEKLRKAIDADDAITGATSSSDSENSKPEPDIFQAALDIVSVRPENAIVVGDSVWDIEAAKKAGIGCVALETGGFSAAELREFGALAVYRGPQDLLENLDDSPLGRLWNAE